VTPVTALFADLRIGLPRSVRAAHDVAFTDPPYTPDGVGLFVARGVEALANPTNGRILLAYGHSESTPALGLQVQQALGRLELLFEAILPDFNHYEGAQAIGSRADLYRLRPTRRSAAIAGRTVARSAATLYTHGGQSVESGVSSGTDQAAVARLVRDRFAGAAKSVLVGPGWPESAGAVSVPRFLGTDKPPSTAGAVITIVDLRPLFGWSLVRAALTATTEQTILIVPDNAYGLRSVAERDRLRDALAPAYAIERVLRSYEGTGASVLVLRRHRIPGPGTEPGTESGAVSAAESAAASVAVRVWDRPHGKLANTWREGLIAVARDAGTELTKNAARAVIDRTGIGVDVVRHRLIDLPVSTLVRLQDRIAETVAMLPARSPDHQ
jgi:hypothetical protein